MIPCKKKRRRYEQQTENQQSKNRRMDAEKRNSFLIEGEGTDSCSERGTAAVFY